MKAISIKQPWANMIAEGDKTIETRTWPTRYRGDILICSSKNPRIKPFGKAIAIAKIVDCVPMEKRHEQFACCEVYEGAWAWILEDIRPICPFPVKGQLGIFEVNIERRGGGCDGE